METKFATKQDLNDVKIELKGDIAELRGELRLFQSQTIAEFKLVRAEMREMENRLTLKLGSLMAAGIVFITMLEHLYK